MNRDDLEMLTHSQTGEVSLVKRGANKKKRFPMFKSQEERMNTENEILKAVLETEVDEEAKIPELFEKKLSAKAEGAVKMALRALSSYKDELPSDVMDKLAAAVGYPAPKEKEYPAPDKEKETKKAKGAEEEEDKMDKKTQVKKTETEQVEKMLKSRDDELKALKKENAEFRKSLKDEQDKRKVDEWTARAKDELSHYPGKSAEEMGKMLKALEDTNPEIAKSQFEQMKQASDMLKESAMLKSAGANIVGTSESSAMGQIEKLAKDVMQKSEDLGMTKEKAVKFVLEQRPDLYDAYLSENPHQTGEA